MIRFYSTVSFTRNYLTENLFIVQIIKRAAEAKQDPKELAQRFEQEFVEDMKTLSVLSNNSLSAAALRFTVMLSVRVHVRVRVRVRVCYVRMLLRSFLNRKVRPPAVIARVTERITVSLCFV